MNCNLSSNESKTAQEEKHILCMMAQTVRKPRIPMLTDVLKLMFICSKFNIVTPLSQ